MQARVKTHFNKVCMVRWSTFYSHYLQFSIIMLSTFPRSLKRHILLNLTWHGKAVFKHVKQDHEALLFFTFSVTRRALFDSIDRLQPTGSSEIGQELDYVIRGGRSDRQVIASSLESVLVGNPVDGDQPSLAAGVGVRSAGDITNILWFGSNALLATGSVHSNSIFTLETSNKSFS